MGDGDLVNSVAGTACCFLELTSSDARMVILLIGAQWYFVTISSGLLKTIVFCL
jgi:hypothetical protein